MVIKIDMPETPLAEQTAALEPIDAAFLAQLQLPISGTDGESLTEMMPGVYEELRRLAASYLHRERAEHTLQPTALVHEAYLRLADQRQLSWENRAHLLGIAARMMRRILTNHAIARAAARRGGENVVRLTLDDALDVYDQAGPKLLDLEEALRHLEALDSRQAQIVEMRFFGGMTVEEIAEVLGVTPRTVMRDWSISKRWLKRELAQPT
ncbi:MAG: ECF-type sigma factor [Verrucomicrobiota bacterium]|nr:ECF-type sigma factor [Verrucomicrobiota bacterium]